MKSILTFLMLLIGGYVFAQAAITVYRPPNDSVTCITQAKLLVYEPVDSLFQKVTKPVISNFIAAIKTCGFGYRYSGSFTDKACQLLLPNWLADHSLSFGDDDFFISFDDHDTASGTCIILHYYLKKAYGTIFHQQLRNTGWRKNARQLKGKKIYIYKNKKRQYTGEIFLNDQISIAYYTSEPQKIQQLKTCILSCRLD